MQEENKNCDPNHKILGIMFRSGEVSEKHRVFLCDMWAVKSRLASRGSLDEALNTTLWALVAWLGHHVGHSDFCRWRVYPEMQDGRGMERPVRERILIHNDTSRHLERRKGGRQCACPLFVRECVLISSNPSSELLPS